MEWLEHMLEGCIGEGWNGCTADRLLDEIRKGIRITKEISGRNGEQRLSNVNEGVYWKNFRYE